MLSSLFILLPLVVLFLASAGLVFLYWFVPKFRFSWLIAALAASLAWASVLFLRERLPQAFALLLPKMTNAFLVSPILRLDEISWPFALGLTTLIFAVILTATARFQYQTNALTWAGSLGLTALGLIAVMAANPLTLVLAWTVIDIAEFYIQVTNLPEPSLSARPVVGFAVRVAGTMMVYWASTIHAIEGSTNAAFTITPEVSIYFLIGVGLRLGVFPLHLTFPQELPIRRGLGNVLRLVTAISSLVVLARFPNEPLTIPFTPVLLGLTALAAFYASLLWATTSDELNGRPYWIIAFTAFSITSVIRGSADGAAIWSLAFLLSGGLLFLYSARDLRLAFLPMLGMWGISGLPFSPTAGVWSGLVQGAYPGLNFIYVISYTLLIYGYIRHAFRPGDSLVAMERWVYLIYPMGLLILPIILIDLGLIENLQLQLNPGWWIGVMTTLIGLGGYFGAQLKNKRLTGGENDVRLEWLSLTGNRILDIFSKVFRFDWLYRFLWVVYRGLGKFVALFTNILEGDAGVLWVLVLLALFFTLLRSAGSA